MITNHSYSVYPSPAFEDAVRNYNGLLVVAAGNNYGMDIDIYPVYPASYDFPHVLTVASTDYYDQLSYFSNIGPTRVHLAAPGGTGGWDSSYDIYSTVPNGYGYMAGTSMAAPHVAGVAALMMAKKPSLTISEIKDIIIRTCDYNPSLDGMVVSNGRLNAYEALKELDDDIIRTVADFDKIRMNLSGSFELANNIDLQGVDWVPIGDVNAPFTGTFEGNGFSLLNLSSSQFYDFSGLFGVINNATISNLTLVDVSGLSGGTVGSLVGNADYSEITNCSVIGVYLFDIDTLGGIVGYSFETEISNCSAENIYLANGSYVGGLVGLNYGKIEKSFSTGYVTSSGVLGGIAGHNNGIISKCYSDTYVYSGVDSYAGGIAGSAVELDSLVINCFALGDVFHNGYFEEAGGIVGVMYIVDNLPNIINCYYAGTLTNANPILGTRYGVYEDCYYAGDYYAGEFMKEETFENWNFVSVWDIVEDQTYPFLRGVKNPFD